eukprot:6188359-Pleurochrysis_carterae.AAC.4
MFAVVDSESSSSESEADNSSAAQNSREGGSPAGGSRNLAREVQKWRQGGLDDDSDCEFAAVMNVRGSLAPSGKLCGEQAIQASAELTTAEAA